MRQPKVIALIVLLIGIFLTPNCKSKGEKIPKSAANYYSNLLYRANPITFKEIAGTWKGENGKAGSATGAVKVIINSDGSFTGSYFYYGQIKDTFSGTAETFVESEETKDAYGEHKTIQYRHRIKFQPTNGEEVIFDFSTDQPKLLANGKQMGYQHGFGGNISLKKEIVSK